ncbi:AimR family lysis-lysogeny pheromone receptor [Thermaerobacillus caldiproteolyticus]|uniref:AimR family lysis-lysogeny pheromone receptor n=1 Tax=Thermaerobacillus caldiproteolyticus TaxID=247480 RepID=UPI00188A255A|nr:AimR family lysis-lysogeny pheromone receptor [Anoxybacillus caldiproteolyticus]QPA32602.1 hypothetical protein ISX45_06610 [Anoxybacillus caldiproteolyticus]
MRKIISQIRQELGRKEISPSYLAKMLNVSLTCINEFFNGTRQLNFSDFLQIINLLFDKDNQQPLILDYCLSTESKEDIREAMEWASNNCFYELLSDLIDIYPSKFSDLYSLLLKRNKNELSPIQLYNELEMIKFKMGNETEIPEVQVLVRIASLYSFLSLKSYGLILPLAQDALNQAESITNRYIRESYVIRIKEVMAIYYMKQLQLEEAIKVARGIINLSNFEKFPLTVNSMLCLLAEIYVYSDYCKSIYYIEKAIEHFKELGMSEKFKNRENMLYATHDFIKITNGMYKNLYLTDKAEEAHYLSRQRDESSKERALYLLEKIAKERGKLSPFQIYYKALALGDVQLMRFAEEEFLKAGDLFYAQLPRRYLVKDSSEN